MADPLVRGLFRRVEAEEIVPHVHPVPGMPPADYLDLIDARFSNPAVEDTTRRLCLDGSNRQPKFILPSVADGIAAGASVTGLALVSALWARYCGGVLEDGTEIAPNDPAWDRLSVQAAAARVRPGAWLEMRDIYGDLGRNPAFAAEFEGWLSALWSEGVAATLARYLGQ
jgi:mannitol 2-dehydrogenase